ncbi:MAG: hypothetical protein AB8B51_19810 [Sedimentitalea sp.]
MFVLALIYLLLGFGALGVLAVMILKIGALLGDCPQSVQQAKTASITITTGFSAIGAGGVILIGALLPVMGANPLTGLLGALGLAALCLGLGFTHAVATLRAVLSPPVAPPV